MKPAAPAVTKTRVRIPAETAQAIFGRAMEQASLDSIRDQDGWIMLTTKLSTHPSPPKLSIFWSTPWPLDDYVAKLDEIKGRMRRAAERLGATIDAVTLDAKAREEYDEKHGEFATPFGRNPDFLNARRIHFDSHDLRVWPHEFSVMTADKMHYYIAVEEAYTLRPEGVGKGAATERLIANATLDTDQRFVRDAALVDGCTDQQALLVALGQDVLEPSTFEPLGWYKLTNKQAINAYCHAWEAREDRES